MHATAEDRVIRLEARPEPLALEPSKTALIVVDMQDAFVNPGGLLDQAGIDISAAPRTVLSRGPLDCRRPLSPNPRKEVAHFFGWVTTSQALEQAASVALGERTGPS